MVEFDYPPTATLVLGVEYEEAQARVDDEDSDIVETDVTALGWAVREFGEESELTLEAFTAATRSQTVDTLRRKRAGDVGEGLLSNWLVAAAVTEAPWLDGDESLVERADIVGQLPPALVDYLQDQLDDLNDLSEGN